MEDIAPKLIQAVTDEFHRLYGSSSKIRSLLEKVKQGTATYAEAQDYALEVSALIRRAYEKHVSSATLPTGKMYYNIAERLIPETLDENYKLVSQYAADVQNKLNKDAGIGLKVQRAELEQDRIDGLVDLASNAERFDDVSEQLLAAFENFSQHIVDSTIQKNADFHYRSGLRPMIIRKAEGKCCKWCRALAGKFDYPDVPHDVYRRHENCRCTVLYDPADGSKSLQNVHSKRWTDPKDYGKIKKKNKPTQRKRFSSEGDPMADVAGPAEQSHPTEIAAFLKEVEASGVELIRHDRENLGYSPGLSPGSPGQLFISNGASYSAWCHEMQHMRDDRDAGWQGMRVMMDKELCIERERRAYAVEIELARESGHENIAKKLEENFEKERRRLNGY
jgi:hypothetical protein